jgi:large subunit ribosomal protein L25
VNPTITDRDFTIATIAAPAGLTAAEEAGVDEAEVEAEEAEEEAAEGEEGEEGGEEGKE